MTTLSRFGVPMGGGAGRGGVIQPKQKWKFRVRVINFGPIQGGMELSQQVMTCGKPQVQQPATAVHSYNSIDYFAGKAEWQPITLEVRDDITNAVSQLVGHQVQKQNNHFEQTSPMAGVNYKFNMFIETLDGGDDNVLEQWYLEGCFLTNVNYDQLDYSSSEFMKITMEIRYSVATQAGGLMPSLPQLINGVMLG